MLLYRCYVLLRSEDFAYIVTWLLHFFHADILQDAAPEQAEPISFLSFIHALHAWKRQMALWAAFYRSRCVKDKDKDMKDKPDRPGAPPEPEDEMGQIQKEILSRCPGNAVQETAKVRKTMKNYFRKKKTIDVAKKLQTAVKDLIKRRLLLEIKPRKEQQAANEEAGDKAAEDTKAAQ